MVTAVRQFAAPVSLVILIVFLSGPGLVWADPRPDPGATHAVAGPPSEAALAPDAAPPRRLADLAGIPADLTRDSEDRAVGQSPQWFDADTSPAGGSWWSRRTTAQKTWFIVGLVVGAYGIYAVASNGSKSHHNGGGGIGY